jgi:hypothetical protein
MVNGAGAIAIGNVDLLTSNACLLSRIQHTISMFGMGRLTASLCSWAVAIVTNQTCVRWMVEG